MRTTVSNPMQRPSEPSLPTETFSTINPLHSELATPAAVATDESATKMLLTHIARRIDKKRKPLALTGILGISTTILLAVGLLFFLGDLNSLSWLAGIGLGVSGSLLLPFAIHPCLPSSITHWHRQASRVSPTTIDNAENDADDITLAVSPEPPALDDPDRNFYSPMRRPPHASPSSAANGTPPPHDPTLGSPLIRPGAPRPSLTAARPSLTATGPSREQIGAVLAYLANHPEAAPVGFKIIAAQPAGDSTAMPPPASGSSHLYFARPHFGAGAVGSPLGQTPVQSSLTSSPMSALPSPAVGIGPADANSLTLVRNSADHTATSSRGMQSPRGRALYNVTSVRGPGSRLATGAHSNSHRTSTLPSPTRGGAPADAASRP